MHSQQTNSHCNSKWIWNFVWSSNRTCLIHSFCEWTFWVKEDHPRNIFIKFKRGIPSQIPGFEDKNLVQMKFFSLYFAIIKLISIHILFFDFLQNFKFCIATSGTQYYPTCPNGNPISKASVCLCILFLSCGLVVSSTLLYTRSYLTISSFLKLLCNFWMLLIWKFNIWKRYVIKILFVCFTPS